MNALTLPSLMVLPCALPCAVFNVNGSAAHTEEEIPSTATIKPLTRFVWIRIAQASAQYLNRTFGLVHRPRPEGRMRFGNPWDRLRDRCIRVSDKPTRREFLVTTSSAALAATVPLASGQTDSPASNNPDAQTLGAIPYSPEELFAAGSQRTFSGESAAQIAMPFGGIGAGCISMNGYGGLQDFSIRNHPSTSALPEGFESSRAAFAVLHVKGASAVTKLVEGPFPAFKIYDQGLQGAGNHKGGFEGFPRFEKCIFKGEYPFGEAHLSDSSVP